MINDYRILIVEDNIRIRKELTVFLEGNGFTCSAPSGFERLVEETDFSSLHLVLLDINLPGVDGFFLCRKIRAISDIPVIVVTSRDTELDELMAMNLGADDFVTKPYHPQILLARVNSVLKRAYRENTADRDRLHCGAFDLILSRSVISYRGGETEITKNELRILSTMQDHLGEIVPRDELMNQLWNNDLFVDDNTLTVNVNRLRNKLAEIGLPEVIETRRGQGYLLKDVPAKEPGLTDRRPV